LLSAFRDLNRIVLDYLIIEGYCDAATEFAKEAGIDISVDYQSIEERMLIRQAVEAGRVDEAVRRVNELEPEVSILSLFRSNTLCCILQEASTPMIKTFHAPL
jgi:hypothetical protein